MSDEMNENLNLRAGEWVEIRSKGEILDYSSGNAGIGRILSAQLVGVTLMPDFTIVFEVEPVLPGLR